MRFLAIAVLAVAVLLGGTGEVRGQKSNRVMIAAFCTNMDSIQAMAEVHKKAFAALDDGNPEVGDQLYLDFMFNNDDEFRCFDVRLNGLMPFSALVLGLANVPTLPRPDCQEIQYGEFWTQSGDVVYSWWLDKVDNCGSV